MSKIIDQMKAVDTGKRVAVCEPMDYTVKIEELPKFSFDTMVEYRIGVELGRSVQCSQEQLSSVSDMVKREVAEYLFGEFRQPLIEIQKALWLNTPVHEINMMIDKLYKQMFEV